MDKVIEASGSCLCGAVKIIAKTISPKVGACHCSMCRKWGGGPFLGLDCQQQVAFSGEDHIKQFSSSEWAARGFCDQCGTHLFYKLHQTQQYIMPVGLFDNINALTFDHQIFIDEKPDFYTFKNKTAEMTGEEVFAAFGAS